jgi:CRP-like cAMP-binding protein
MTAPSHPSHPEHPESRGPVTDRSGAADAHAGASDAGASDAGGLVPVAPRNEVLRALPADEFARLLPHLEPYAVAPLDVLADAERPLRHAYFPETGLISVLRRMRDGTLIEAYAVGRDGMVGIPHLLGDPGSPAGTVLGEVPGTCRRITFAALRALLPGLPTLERLLQRRLLALLDEVQQAVACNSLHTVEQRCARWLLQTRDRVGGDEFLLTHEVLAQMLAVRRAGVTVAAGALQKAGLITYSRGRVRVLDRAGLEAAACECYAVVRAHTGRLLGARVGSSD